MGETPDTRPTSEFHAGNFSTADVDRLVAGLDAQDQADGVRRLRAWAQGALDPRPGERVIDIGSGTGTQTLALAAAVAPSGDALGIEANPVMREVAERRAAAAGGPARFLHGDAVALPVPDASVDVVWCERVLQHLSEPDKAVREIARVLRPGGRVALIDSDWGTALLHPADPDTLAALTKGILAMAANPYSGRRLLGQVADAGLVADDQGSQALIQDRGSVTWPLVRMMTESTVRSGLLTEEQRDRLHAELAAAAERGALHMSVTMFAVVAHRPR
ncbi:methyltransferase domain-containing protein [Streptomyces geranii]|uniref:methyltransferase domain-containing protein n=1 Tax=Streptomyces geranii TaxID=2058923 RepID=UPI000D02FEB8|nr:methyltransferase domain-containing protein [Streptomyces geranii]